ncbi:NAD(P)/FAD-dependent oxidoreductase [Noviherbaspirillum sedimenti]|uniref:Pyridine nucleotide-disulfide oxidoreductase n=1 Tax=Noviherbaspirillum sedimenti TaxID=2320865 RepID=A0A3A3G0B4_9BURK|nr:FAD-dependent oxidoreductase [Noviherbaspirillum sedimenti]RJG01361.1 pyridine nucleotide-disulfide oxidoreductase [Noviherbaspirillum sedimenti]
MSNNPLIIVGAGHAGVEVSVAAREAGWNGEIVLISEEKHLPYHRPPLSKSYLAGETAVDTVVLKPASIYERAGIRLLLGNRVESIDRAARNVALSGGSELRYERLVLATGGRPRTLPISVLGAGQVRNLHYLRTLDDANRIKSQLIPGRRMVVVGGGYVGLELAALAVKAGLMVTVLEAAERVLARVTAQVVGDFYAKVHRAAGVTIETSQQVEGFELDSSGANIVAVRCSSGDLFPADLVVAGIGLVPNTELASAAGLTVADGVLVDEFARTSDPAIYATGDCTRYFSQLYQRSIRLESVPNALEQARTVAASLCGKQRRYDSVPWFWSDQYDLKLKMVGLSSGYDQVILRGDLSERSFSAFYLRGRRVLAADTVNRAPDFLVAKQLVGAAAEVDPSDLANPAISLRDLLPSPGRPPVQQPSVAR